jgi:hypothetical protein
LDYAYDAATGSIGTRANTITAAQRSARCYVEKLNQN